MQPPVPLLQVITIPPGATKLQQRIVIDGVRGAIFEYAAGNPLGNLVSSWASKAGVDPYGNVYPQGFNAGSGSSFSGTDFIINAKGIVFYNGSPALGNVALSITSAGFVDQFGNTIIGSGVLVYNSSGGGFAALLSGSAPALVLEPPNTVSMAIAPQIQGFANNAGAVNEALATSVFSGQENAGNANTAVQLFSESNDGTLTATGKLVVSGVSILSWTQAGVFISTDNGAFTGRPDLSVSDTTDDINANNGTQPCTRQYTLFAGDPQVGTNYYIETDFTGVFEASPFGFLPYLNAATPAFSAGYLFAAGFLGAGAGFTGTVKMRVEILSIGVGGTCNIFITASAGAQVSRTAANSATVNAQVTALAINTNLPNSIGIASQWSAAVAGQTVTVHGSTFTRKGA